MVIIILFLDFNIIIVIICINAVRIQHYRTPFYITQAFLCCSLHQTETFLSRHSLDQFLTKITVLNQLIKKSILHYRQLINNLLYFFSCHFSCTSASFNSKQVNISMSNKIVLSSNETINMPLPHCYNRILSGETLTYNCLTSGGDAPAYNCLT